MNSKTKNLKSREQLAALAGRAFGIGLAEGAGAVCELQDGWFNAVYELVLADGRCVVLKIAPPPGAPVMAYERALMATEVATLRRLRADARIPVPAVLVHDESCQACDSACFFMEKARGASLEHVRAGLSRAQEAAVDRHAGEILRTLHGYRGDWFGYPGNPALRAHTWREAFLAIVESVLADAARQGVAFPRPAPAIRALLQRHASSLDEVRTPSLVHWDAWDKNFFVDDGRVTGLIDFERALWADPLMESLFRPLSWSGPTEAMRGYGKTDFSAAETRRCRLYSLHLGLVMRTECAFRDYPGDAIRRQALGMIETNLAWLEAAG